MTAKQYVMGVFPDEDRVADTLGAMKQSNWHPHRVYSPYHSHIISAALNLKTSRVGTFTLIGGILGFFIGFGLAGYTAAQWDLVVSGKPVIALVPFFIVGFECTILFGIFGNVLGLLTQARLPHVDLPDHYDRRFTGQHFGLLASCDQGDEEQLIALMRQNEGEARTIADTAGGEPI